MATSVKVLDVAQVGSSAAVDQGGEAGGVRRALGARGSAPASITCAEICYLVETGGLPVVRLGGEVLVPLAGVADYLARHAPGVPDVDASREPSPHGGFGGSLFSVEGGVE